MLNLKEKNQFSKFMGIILWVWDRNKRDFKRVIYGESRIIPVILFTM